MSESYHRHATIPVFVTHAACPHLCVFCNQKKIAGKEIQPEKISDYLKKAVDNLDSSFTECDIAFFGGSFTGIEHSRMVGFLSEAHKYLGKGKVTGIRLSTRPDYISEEILDSLEKYGVTDIELGVQSLNDKVLELSERGHTVDQTINAVAKIKKRNFRLVLQLMPGLPGDTDETIRKTFETAANLSPDGIRIYPTVVIADTKLETMFKNGEYMPLTIEKAVSLTAEAVQLFASKGIKILRMGLHSSDLSQNNGVVGGPYHPAFGEMVIQRIYLNEAIKRIDKINLKESDGILITVGKGGYSRMTGQKRKNTIYLEEKYGMDVLIRETESRFAKNEICGLPVIDVSPFNKD